MLDSIPNIHGLTSQDGDDVSDQSFVGPEWTLAKRRCGAGGDASRGDLR